MMPLVLGGRFYHPKRLCRLIARFIIISSLAVPGILASAANLLINIDVGTYSQTNVGFAAIGQSTNDFWNGIETPWQAFGVLSNLLAAARTIPACKTGAIGASTEALG